MTELTFEPMRRSMVASQLRTTGVNDPRVVAAMGEVARERFVPADRRAIAYADVLVPLAEGRALNPPMTLGKLLTSAELQGDERALVIGAGTGYAAAVLARLVGHVTALEEDSRLAEAARPALTGTGVELVEGPLARGWAANAPYDFILIDGAVEELPPEIVGQAEEHGRIALVLVDRNVTRLAIGRVVGGALGLSTFADVMAAILPGFEKPRGFTF